MKRCFISLKTSGWDLELSEIIQVAGILDIDGTIMDTFNFKIQFDIDALRGDVSDESYLLVKSNLEPLSLDPERLPKQEVYNNLLNHINKFVDVNDPLDRFEFIAYNSNLYESLFFNKFFTENGKILLDSYFWYPPIDVLNVALFMLEGNRNKFSDFRLESIAKFFGFRVDPGDNSLDSFYRVDLLRNIYYILEKFKAPVVTIKKATMN